jgi:hypothetical protein
MIFNLSFVKFHREDVKNCLLNGNFAIIIRQNLEDHTNLSSMIRNFQAKVLLFINEFGSETFLRILFDALA